MDIANILRATAIKVEQLEEQREAEIEQVLLQNNKLIEKLKTVKAERDELQRKLQMAGQPSSSAAADMDKLIAENNELRRQLEKFEVQQLPKRKEADLKVLLQSLTNQLETLTNDKEQLVAQIEELEKQRSKLSRVDGVSFEKNRKQIEDLSLTLGGKRKQLETVTADIKSVKTRMTNANKDIAKWEDYSKKRPRPAEKCIACANAIGKFYTPVVVCSEACALHLNFAK